MARNWKWKKGLIGACLLTMGRLALGSSVPLYAQDGGTPSVGSAADESSAATGRSIGAADSGSNAPEPSGAPEPSQVGYDNSLGLHVFKNIVLDQKALWTSPTKLRLEDSAWLVPAIGVTAGLFQTDRDTSLHFFSNNPSTLKHYDNLSNYGLFGMAGGTGALYLWGSMTRDDHKKEAGLLAGEAAVDSLAIVTALKYATGRQRPQVGNHAGDFWSGGDSFPSDHAAISMAIAGVLAHEYPDR